MSRHLLVTAAIAILAASCASETATIESQVAEPQTVETTETSTPAATETTATAAAEPTTTETTEPETETVDVFRLDEGECLLMPTQGISGEEVETLESIPCEQPHDGEVIAIIVVAGDNDAPYPGEDAISTEAETGCLAAFKSVTGRDFATDPVWDLTFLSPTSDSWTFGNDREIVCIALPLDGELTTDLASDDLST